jgi:hypothetical protein
MMLIVFPAAGSSFAYDIGGRWLLRGGGYAERSVVRVELSDSGYLDLLVTTDNEDRYLTGYNINIVLDASKFDINAWRYSKAVTLQIPVKIPELNPTMNRPLKLPSATVDGMTCAVTLTSTTSGIVDIYGDLDVDDVGRVRINSQSAIWREGTTEPSLDDKLSGCDAGIPVIALLTLVPLLLAKRVRKT